LWGWNCYKKNEVKFKKIFWLILFCLKLKIIFLNHRSPRIFFFNYLNSFFVFSNQSRKPKQFINPAWAQTLTVTYRDAFNIIDNRKLVADASLYFPGLFPNHSLVIDGAYQKRDTLGDFFSKTFSYARGYQDLNQRRMYKVGVNYHFPLCYPDWGFGNIIFFLPIFCLIL